MTVVETPAFLRRAKGILSDSGKIMEGTGGVRKLRWAREGEGKSGGYRVIYYFHSERIPLFALLIYGKNEKANLTQAEKNDMRRLTALLAAYGRQKP